jgi:tetratricopeptide (TPR) repeat protein
MVGNEEHVIERMLLSCYAYTSFYVIQCNGNDNTQVIIDDFFASKNIPGFTYTLPWEFPGKNRDHALRTLLAANSQCDWILRMDADETLEIDSTFDWTLLENTSVDAWNVTAKASGALYFRTWLWNANRNWTFQHDLRHECILLNGTQNFERRNLPYSFRHVITNDGQTWSSPEKFCTDALLLENQHLSSGTLFNDLYHFFYIAKSYNDAYLNSSLQYEYSKELARRCIFYCAEFIERRGTATEETYYAAYMKGNAHKFCNEYSKAIEAYSLAERILPRRNEHLVGLAEIYETLKNYRGMHACASEMRNKTNPFPNLYFLIHSNAYPDTGTYVEKLYQRSLELLNS